MTLIINHGCVAMKKPEFLLSFCCKVLSWSCYNLVYCWQIWAYWNLCDCWLRDTPSVCWFYGEREKIAQTFAIVDYARNMNAHTSYNYGEYGSLQHLFSCSICSVVVLFPPPPLPPLSLSSPHICFPFWFGFVKLMLLKIHVVWLSKHLAILHARDSNIPKCSKMIVFVIWTHNHYDFQDNFTDLKQCNCWHKGIRSANEKKPLYSTLLQNPAQAHMSIVLGKFYLHANVCGWVSLKSDVIINLIKAWYNYSFTLQFESTFVAISSLSVKVTETQKSKQNCWSYFRTKFLTC